MDVKFIAVPSDAIDEVPIKNGQILALTDIPGYYYDMSGERHRVDSSINEDTLPASGQDGIVYVSTKGNDAYPAGIYFWNQEDQSWVPIGVTRIKGAAEGNFRSGEVIISPKDIGLGKVENKSVSEIFEELQDEDIVVALGYRPVSSQDKGIPGGVASLDDTGKIPASQLPASKESIVRISSLSDFPETGTLGALYQAEDTGNYYVWNGKKYTGLSSMASNVIYSGFTIDGASNSFYNNYCIGVSRNIPELIPNMPSSVTFKLVLTNPNQLEQSSIIIANALFGPGSSTSAPSGEITSCIVEHGSVPVVSELCIANLTSNGWMSGQPAFLGFHLENSSVFNISADIISYTNCSIHFLENVTRHGELSTANHFSSPNSFSIPTSGLYSFTSSDAHITNNSSSLITSSQLYKLFGNSPVPKAHAIQFDPTDTILATNVQDAIIQSADVAMQSLSGVYKLIDELTARIEELEESQNEDPVDPPSPTTYKVTYVVDTGSNYSEQVESGESCLNPTTFSPVKSGWTFVGWSENPEANADVLSEKLMEDSDLTLYAVYKQSVTLSYDGNGADEGQVEPQTDDRYYNGSGDINDPTFILANNAFVRNNHEFTKWDLGDAGSSITLSISTTAKAEWLCIDNIILDYNDGNANQNEYSWSKVPNVDGPTIKLSPKNKLTELVSMDLTDYNSCTVKVYAEVTSYATNQTQNHGYLYLGFDEEPTICLAHETSGEAMGSSSDGPANKKTAELTLDISELTGEHELTVVTQTGGEYTFGYVGICYIKLHN